MGWVRRHWRGLAGGILVIWQAVLAAVRTGGDIDFVISRYSEPDWVKTVLEYLLNPPPWSVLIIIAGGLGLIWWDAARRRPSIQNSSIVENPPLPTESHQPPTQSASTQPVSPKSDPVKVAFIDTLYPQIHDFSETYVDEFGNKSQTWRQDFLQGRAAEFFEKMEDARKSIGQKYATFRPLFMRHKNYDDVYNLHVEMIARVGVIRDKLVAAKAISEKLSHRFDEKSISLIEGEMMEFQKSIGALRSYLSQGCMPRLLRIRREANT